VIVYQILSLWWVKLLVIRRSPKNFWGRWSPVALGCGRVWWCLTPRNMHLPTCVTMPHSLILGQSVRASVIMEICHRILTPHAPRISRPLRSLVPTRLPVTSYYSVPNGLISYRVRDSICKNVHPPYNKHPRWGVPLEFCNSGGSKKLNDAPTRMLRKCDDVSVRLDTITELDRQTDRRTDRQTDGRNW